MCNCRSTPLSFATYLFLSQRVYPQYGFVLTLQNTTFTSRVLCHGHTELMKDPGTGMEVLHNSQKFRVGIRTLYPYPHPHRGIFTRAYRTPGIVSRAYRTSRSSGYGYVWTSYRTCRNSGTGITWKIPPAWFWTYPTEHNFGLPKSLFFYTVVFTVVFCVRYFGIFSTFSHIWRTAFLHYVVVELPYVPVHHVRVAGAQPVVRSESYLVAKKKCAF